MTRVQLCARVHVLRQCLDALADQSDRDAEGKFFCVGAMKVELVRLEADVRQLDGVDGPHARLEAQLRQIRGVA